MRTPTRQMVLTRLGLLTRAMTLGVRALVQDPERRVLLVRHTYLPGWYLPGGGVEPGETLQHALVREIDEEGSVLADAPPRLFGIYLNRQASRRDHVALFVVSAFHMRNPLRPPDAEIAEAGFFPRDALPPDTTPATHRRLGEVLDGLSPSEEW